MKYFIVVILMLLVVAIWVLIAINPIIISIITGNYWYMLLYCLIAPEFFIGTVVTGVIGLIIAFILK